LLAERSHEAKFLHEVFTARLGAGNIEIESNSPVVATAVTLSQGEMSALPMLPSPLTYTFRTDNDGEIDDAEMASLI